MQGRPLGALFHVGVQVSTIWLRGIADVAPE